MNRDLTTCACCADDVFEDDCCALCGCCPACCDCTHDAIELSPCPECGDMYPTDIVEHQPCPACLDRHRRFDHRWRMNF